VIATAERLRHLAWQSAQQPPGSQGLTVTSARQAAETSTVTSHNCAIIARVLAARTSNDDSAISADLAAEAHAAQHGDLPQVVAAVHHACEALALLSETEHSQLRQRPRPGGSWSPPAHSPTTTTSPAPTPPPHLSTPPHCSPATATPSTPATRAPPQSSAPPKSPALPAAHSPLPGQPPRPHPQAAQPLTLMTKPHQAAGSRRAPCLAHCSKPC